MRNDKRRGGEKKRGRLGTGRVKTRLDCQPLFGNMSPRSTPPNPSLEGAKTVCERAAEIEPT